MSIKPKKTYELKPLLSRIEHLILVWSLRKLAHRMFPEMVALPGDKATFSISVDLIGKSTTTLWHVQVEQLPEPHPRKIEIIVP